MDPPNPLGFKDYKVPFFNHSYVGSPGVLPSNHLQPPKGNEHDNGAQLPRKQFMKTINFKDDIISIAKTSY